MFADYSLLKVMLDQISAKIEFCRRCVRKAQLTLTCSRAGGLRLAMGCICALPAR